MPIEFCELDSIGILESILSVSKSKSKSHTDSKHILEFSSKTLILF